MAARMRKRGAARRRAGLRPASSSSSAEREFVTRNHAAGEVELERAVALARAAMAARLVAAVAAAERQGRLERAGPTTTTTGSVGVPFPSRFCTDTPPGEEGATEQ